MDKQVGMISAKKDSRSFDGLQDGLKVEEETKSPERIKKCFKNGSKTIKTLEEAILVWKMLRKTQPNGWNGHGLKPH